MAVYLVLLEKFHGSCGGTAGKYTASGITVGECKLFTMLHCLVMIKPDVLSGYPAVKDFYDAFGVRTTTAWLLLSASPITRPGQSQRQRCAPPMP